MGGLRSDNCRTWCRESSSQGLCYPRDRVPLTGGWDGLCTAMGQGPGKLACGALAAPHVGEEPERPPYRSKGEWPLHETSGSAAVAQSC